MTKVNVPSLGVTGRMVVTTLMGTLLAFCVMALWLGWVQWQRYDAALEAAIPRIARMQGIALAHDEIVAALEGTRAILSRYAYPSEVDAAHAASDFQSRVRDALQTDGLSLVGSQQLPPRAGQGFDEVALSLSLKGDLSQLRSGLAALATISPRVRVEQMRLQPVGARMSADAAPDQINVQTHLIVARMQKP